MKVLGLGFVGLALLAILNFISIILDISIQMRKAPAPAPAANAKTQPKAPEKKVWKA